MFDAGSFSGWQSPAAKKGDPVFTFNARLSPAQETPAPSLASPDGRDRSANVQFGTPKINKRFSSPEKSTKLFDISPAKLTMMKKAAGLIERKLESGEFADVIPINTTPTRIEITYEVPKPSLRSRLSRLDPIMTRQAKPLPHHAPEVPPSNDGDQIDLVEPLELSPGVVRRFRVLEGSVELAMNDKVWTASKGGEIALQPGKTYRLSSADTENPALIIELV